MDHKKQAMEYEECFDVICAPGRRSENFGAESIDNICFIDTKPSELSQEMTPSIASQTKMSESDVIISDVQRSSFLNRSTGGKQWKVMSFLLFISASIEVITTICFVFISSSNNPKNIFSSAERSILALNISSTLSVLLIGEL